MGSESFEELLTGGHPNSLGNTIEVVEIVMREPARLEELYECYSSPDAAARLRTSNALKRIARKNPEWLVPLIDRLQTEIARLDQASAQWTLADLFHILRPLMSAEQKVLAQTIMRRNLETHDDWIVLCNSMQVLAEWSADDAELREWLIPRLENLSNDKRKAVAGRAKKMLAEVA